MKTKKILGVKIFGLVALLLFLLAVNCAKDGTAPVANIPPNTFVTNYQIALAPDSATYYPTTISWLGSDVDGAVFWYYWSIINSNGDSLYGYHENVGLDGNVTSIDTTNLSDWQPTNTLNMTMHLDFSDFSNSYIFRVKAEDNDRAEDPTPAEEIIAIDRVREFNYAPNTEIVEGPANGATTGSGIHFVLKGTDVDGVVTGIEYKVDYADWVIDTTNVVAGILTFNLKNLANGAHTLTFRAVDNFDKVDPTPVSISVVVDNTLAPELALSLKDGQGFIVPYTAPTIETIEVDFTATVDFYYSYIDSFLVTTSTGVDTITTQTSYTFENVDSGAYWIDVTAYDIGGNSTSTGHVNFTVGVLFADQGVLCVNGVSWADYGSDAVNLWDNGSPWGDRSHFKCWDLFDDAPLGSVPDFADSLLGIGSVPTWMFDTTFFKAIVWMGNEYSGDFEYYTEREDEIMAYLEMGGNMILPVRYGIDWFFDDLATYCGVVSTGWTTSAGADDLTAKVDSLTDIGAATAQSLWDIPTTNSSDNVWLYEAATAAPGKQAGFVTLPNGAGGGGGFCYIAGRPYRWEQADLKDNLDVILRYYFGISN